MVQNSKYIEKLVHAYNLPRDGIVDRPVTVNKPDINDAEKTVNKIYVIPSRNRYVVIPHDQPENTLVMLPQILNEQIGFNVIIVNLSPYAVKIHARVTDYINVAD